MRYVDEYRDRETVERLVRAIESEMKRPHVLMEVCGGQTHALVRYGIDQMLPAELTLLHGPGCPVCVTATETIDRAHAIASEPNVIFCSFGDMLRVPGSHADLLRLKADGKDIRIVYSPLDALALAAKHPEKRVVFFAIGFETTAPANAMAAKLARKRELTNFSLLTAHVLVPPMLEVLLSDSECNVEAFLGPGHVCSIMGTHEYEPIAARYGAPIAVSGFEPVDLLTGILDCIRQLEKGDAKVTIPYSRVVTPEGNRVARKTIDEVFEVCDRPWRGMGVVAKSGLGLRADYRAFDAERVFDLGRHRLDSKDSSECISGEILRGKKKPYDCPAYGTRCTPERPLGATMVSSEGACAAYNAYGRTKNARSLPLLQEQQP